MSGLQCLATENIWFDKARYDEAEMRFYEGVNGPATQRQQVEQATQKIQGFFGWGGYNVAKEQRLGLKRYVD